MGMAPGLGERWAIANSGASPRSTPRIRRLRGAGGSVARLRMILQSLVLGLGAYLVIYQEATAGVIIASSILVSRTLGAGRNRRGELEAFRGRATEVDETVQASRNRAG